jgi:hypothetical protein
MDIDTQSELTQVETHSHAALHGSEDGSPTQNQEPMPSLVEMVTVRLRESW